MAVKYEVTPGSGSVKAVKYKVTPHIFNNKTKLLIDREMSMVEGQPQGQFKAQQFSEYGQMSMGS